MNVRRWITTLPRRSLTVQVSVLAITIGGAYAVAIFVAIGIQGWVGVVAASMAAGTCFVSATAALILSRSLSDPQYGSTGILLPMAVRTGIPLMLALVIRLRGQGLVDGGFVYYLVGFYLLALAVEVPMSLPVRILRKRQSGSSKAEDWKTHG